MTESLSDLAHRFGTDKGPDFHDYTNHYDRLLGSRRSSVTRVLEIGVMEGASLQMWAAYFPNAWVLGIDKKRPTKATELGDRILVMQGDATIPSVAAEAGMWGPFDLIVDDGSHHPADVEAAFLLYFPHVRKGGLYIVEDVLPTLNQGHAFWIMEKRAGP